MFSTISRNLLKYKFGLRSDTEFAISAKADSLKELLKEHGEK